jgi:hypothetical protein
MLFKNALATLAIRGEIGRSGHTRQSGDVRRTTIEVARHLTLDNIPWWRQTIVHDHPMGVLSR